jgi:hypothetical protein
MVGFLFFVLVLAGVAYLAFVSIRAVNRFRVSMDAATKALESVAPMLKSEELVRLSNGFVLMGRQGAEQVKVGMEMLEKMKALDKTISLFYSFAVAKDEAENPGKARPAGGGRFSGYDEERAAASEAATKSTQEPPG